MPSCAAGRPLRNRPSLPHRTLVGELVFGRKTSSPEIGSLVLRACLARLEGALWARVGAVRVPRSAAAGHGTEIGHRMHGPWMRLTGRQSTPAFGGAFYYPIKTLYQLQPSFHTSSTEPEPTARARRAGKEFY